MTRFGPNPLLVTAHWLLISILGLTELLLPLIFILAPQDLHHKIQKDILNLSDQHNLLVGIVKKHEHQIQELANDLNHLTNIIRLLITYNPALVYAKFERNV